MTIASTINIRDDLLRSIHILKDQSRLSQNAILCWFLNQIHNAYNLNMIKNRSIQYQLTDKSYSFKQVYYTIECDEYEILLDDKKICKMSLSLLLFVSVNLFRSQFEKEFCSSKKIQKTITYNYIPIVYSWTCEIDNNTRILTTRLKKRGLPLKISPSEHT